MVVIPTWHREPTIPALPKKYSEFSMERKKVTIELTISTGFANARQIENDLDKILMPVRNKEAGSVMVVDYDIKKID